MCIRDSSNPPLPYPVEVGPYIAARGSGGALKLPQRVRFLVHFRTENASGDNHCLDEFFLVKTHLFHTSLVEILPSENLDEIWCQYTRMMGLSCGKEIVTMSLVI